MIHIANKRRKPESLQAEFPGAIIADVTSGTRTALLKLSPFYPHGDIPVPFSPGWTSACVEAVWQGLKVFEHAGIDTDLFACTTMKNIKRTVRKFGPPLGHRKGVEGTELLGYLEAREQIYLPTYRWMLEHKVIEIVRRLAEASRTKEIVLLDYNTNEDIYDLSKPLSHAGLVKAYAEGRYPGQTFFFESGKGERPEYAEETGGGLPQPLRSMKKRRKTKRDDSDPDDGDQLFLF